MMQNPLVLTSRRRLLDENGGESSTISSNSAQFDDFIDEKRHFRRIFVDLKIHVTSLFAFHKETAHPNQLPKTYLLPTAFSAISSIAFTDCGHSGCAIG